MNNKHDFAGRALKAGRLPPNSRTADGGILIAFPIHRTKRYQEAMMFQHGDDAGRCRNGLSAQEYRKATAADRATYRKWAFAMAVFYFTLLLTAGVVAILTESSPGLTRLTSLSAHTMAASPGSH
jgi:hypothetical protein